MAAMSSFDAFGPVILVLVIWLLVKGGFRMRAFILTAALIVGVTDGLISKPLKQLVSRPRPFQALNDVRQVDLAKASPRLLALVKPAVVKRSRVQIGEIEGRAFPSSHTMNTFAAAIVTVVFFGRRAAWIFLLPALVGYSRIYTGAHWPSDVLTSLVLAGGTTLLLVALVERLWRSQGHRISPSLHSRHPSLLAS